MTIKTEENFSIPKEAHIPRPANDNLESYSKETDSGNWEREFNIAMGNLTLASTDSARLVSQLKTAKTNIEQALSFFDSLASKNEQKTETILFDLPHPVPDCDRKLWKDSSIEKNPSPEMNIWSREKIELCEVIDENSVEISRLNEYNLALLQENREITKELKRSSKLLNELNSDLEFCALKEREYILAAKKLLSFVGEIKYRGGIYTGESIDVGGEMVPNGFGKWVSDSENHLYVGFFKNGFREGLGKLESGTGETYEGFWKNDFFEGYGVFRTEKEVYKGDFKAGKKSGMGTNKSFDNELYEGSWEEGLKCGYGEIAHRDGSVYKGNFRRDFPQGQGVFFGNDGSKYKGSWENGLEHGKGTFSAPDGMSYVGDWNEGRKHGLGVFTHSEGWSYEGQFVEGKKEGVGKMLFKEAVYEGDWKDDCRHGEGKYTFANSSSYEGQWKSNLYEGNGVYSFADGAKYVGGFHKGWPNGEGVFSFPSGVEIKREWKEHLPSGYRVELPWQKTMYR